MQSPEWGAQNRGRLGGLGCLPGSAGDSSLEQQQGRKGEEAGGSRKEAALLLQAGGALLLSSVVRFRVGEQDQKPLPKKQPVDRPTAWCPQLLYITVIWTDLCCGMSCSLLCLEKLPSLFDYKVTSRRIR